MLPTGNIIPTGNGGCLQVIQPYTPFPAAYNGTLGYWSGQRNQFGIQFSGHGVVNRFQRPIIVNNFNHNPMIRRYEVSPSGKQSGCLAVWNNVRAVPLSFEATQSEAEECSQSDESANSSFEDDTESRCSLDGEFEKNQPMQQAQNDAVNSVLNPGNRKKDIVASWFTRSCLRLNNVENYQSAVLMSNCKRPLKKHRRLSREERFAARHPHLVQMFGKAYIRWRESRVAKKLPQTTTGSLTVVERINYSQLYDACIPSQIMWDSRQEDQIKEAVDSISAVQRTVV